MTEKQAWIVAVDMGYGHQRAAYPLRHLSPTGKVISANNYQGIPQKDYRIWHDSEVFYGFVSRLISVPLIGQFLFNLYDKLQSIKDFYPRRDLSAPNLQLKQMYSFMKKGWGEDLIKYLNTKDIPLITTFFVTAFMAEEHKFKNDIYLVLCDADISRTWVPINPQKSRIKYLAPCRRVVDRLKLYGVKEKNIFLTGFPLPEENLGSSDLHVLKADLLGRIHNLDPLKRYRQKYADTVARFLKTDSNKTHGTHPLTITFAVGGAGAQKTMAHDILVGLKKRLLQGDLHLNLVAGSRNDVYLYFQEKIKECGLKNLLGKNIKIIFALEKEDYFRQFNEALRTTDVLWTKPSELVFYTALGVPLITAPSLGAQEVYNRTWLKTIGAGISQNNPKYTHEWLFDWLDSGWLAEAAMSGFLDGRQFGVSNIKEVVFNHIKNPTKSYQLM
ncbi:MAG: hypothetical protein G01um101413_489 [Parcubacteria group bacterium Gr01-1014_13]|nr:MAG: hypothetical protein G01um101413_489 [Parcubacteria group bacterium Gr01-1014_13]